LPRCLASTHVSTTKSNLQIPYLMNLKKLDKWFFLGLLFITVMSNAQSDFRPGYIINLSGDTLIGEIDYRGDLLMNHVCTFKGVENKITEYSPNDIAAFRFIDSKYYVSKQINENRVFLEYLIKGKISIYYMKDDIGDHYYLDKEDIKLTEIPYEEGVRYANDKQVFYKSKKHMGLLNYYMQDAPEFQSRISSIEKPAHQNLIKLAEDYHSTVCKGEQCIIYEKPISFIKILPELLGGVIKYSNVEGLNDKYYSHAGIIAHIWMPKSSEKLYFRTGVLISQLDFEGEKVNFYKIPLQFEYIYPKGTFRPRFAYGWNFYVPSYTSVSFDIGTNVELSETFVLSATSDIEFNPIAGFFPRDLLSISLKLGLFLRI
jgi:hypothetical protein